MANRSKTHAAKKARTGWRDRLWTWFFIALLLGIVGFSIYTQIIHHP